MTDTITNLWVYNIALLQGEPHILLARRKNCENEFWHLPCGGITTPEGRQLPDESAFLQEAGKAIQREAGLSLNSQKFSMLYYDQTPDSSWNDKIGCAHVLADHGEHKVFLPSVTAKIIQAGKSERGLVEARWVKLSDIQAKSAPYMGSNAPASSFIFFNSLPLRSTVANTIGQHVLPFLRKNYGPLHPALERLEMNMILPKNTASLVL